MSSSQQRVANNQEPISTLDLTSPRNKRIIIYSANLIAILIAMGFGTVLYTSGYSQYWILIIVILLIPNTYIHEIFHCAFFRIFSGLKPHIGFIFPFPYSALADGARITRNQGIFCALAPCLFIVPLLILPSFFVSFLPKVILQAGASVAFAQCFGDFFLIHWLLKYPKAFKMGRVGLSNALFKDT